MTARALILLAAAAIGLNALTIVGHFAAVSAPAPAERPATPDAGGAFTDFAAYDLSRFERRMAAGGAVLVAVSPAACAVCAARAPVLRHVHASALDDDVPLLRLDPLACPGVARALDAWQPGLLVLFTDGREAARSAPDASIADIAAMLRDAR